VKIIDEISIIDAFKIIDAALANEKQRQRVQKSINTLSKRLKRLQKTELEVTKQLKVYKKKLEEIEG